MRLFPWILVLAVVPVAGVAQDTPSGPAVGTPTAASIVEESQRAFFYCGDTMKAKMTMDLIGESGDKRTRVLTMLRRNDPNGRDQKFFLYFHEPGDVRRTAFLVWKYAEKEDDRWIFIPAVDMVRRVAASDSRSSFVGSDFTYEDISGRDLSADEHTLLREEKLDQVDCFVVQSTPKTSADYVRKISWIDRKTFLPRKEEYYDAQNELQRVFTADKIEDITVGEGEARKVFPTIVKRTMKNVKSGHRTEVTFTSVAYDLGLEDKDFSERTMQKPPGSWIR